MRVLICWAGTSGYMTACWKEAQKSLGLELEILALDKFLSGNAKFDSAAITDGLSCRFLNEDEWGDDEVVAAAAREFRPDVVVISGWFYRPYTRLAMNRSLAGVPFILSMDNPLTRNWRQRLAPLKIGRLLRRVDVVWVPGERGWQLARYWKVPESKIRRGLYGIDFETAALANEARRSGGRDWPKGFLYCGRYIPEKNVDVLVDGYRLYRTMVSDPWPLECCGTGPLATVLAEVEGVRDRGFVQPGDLRDVWAGNGVFLLLSRYDPWGVVIPEACAAGLPVICSNACGSAVELVRPYYNGLIVATGDSRAAAEAMRWVHANHRELPAMGARGQILASAYSAEMWSKQFSRILAELR
jgi:glycosyltransferase involved in cell wall biosynthesis